MQYIELSDEQEEVLNKLAQMEEGSLSFSISLEFSLPKVSSCRNYHVDSNWLDILCDWILDKLHLFDNRSWSEQPKIT